MAKSLRVRIKSLRVKHPVIQQEEIDDILRKLNGHDRELLAKKEEPLKAINVVDLVDFKVGTCGACGACRLNSAMKYCDQCGQKIGWEV